MAFYIGIYAYAIIVQNSEYDQEIPQSQTADNPMALRGRAAQTQADQLLPQLLIEKFDTLPIQCRRIERMHEGVWKKKRFDEITVMRT